MWYFLSTRGEGGSHSHNASWKFANFYRLPSSSSCSFYGNQENVTQFSFSISTIKLHWETASDVFIHSSDEFPKGCLVWESHRWTWIEMRKKLEEGKSWKFLGGEAVSKKSWACIRLCRLLWELSSPRISLRTVKRATLSCWIWDSMFVLLFSFTSFLDSINFEIFPLFFFASLIWSYLISFCI